MHWHPPQNSTKSKQGAADLPTYTVIPNGLNPSKISSLTHAISQIFPNKFQSSHIISVSGRCIRSIFCQNLSNSCRNKYDRSISKSNFCLGFFIHWAQLCLPTVCCKEFKYTPASLANAPCLHELWPSLSSPERTFRAQGMCKVRHAEDSTSNQFLNLKETAAWRHQSIQQHPPLTA